MRFQKPILGFVLSGSTLSAHAEGAHKYLCTFISGTVSIQTADFQADSSKEAALKATLTDLELVNDQIVLKPSSINAADDAGFSVLITNVSCKIAK